MLSHHPTCRSHLSHLSKDAREVVPVGAHAANVRPGRLQHHPAVGELLGELNIPALAAMIWQTWYNSVYIYLYLSISIYIYLYLYLSISIYIYLDLSIYCKFGEKSPLWVTNQFSFCSPPAFLDLFGSQQPDFSHFDTGMGQNWIDSKNWIDRTRLWTDPPFYSWVNR